MASEQHPEGGRPLVIHAWNANRQALSPNELVHKPNNGACSECRAGMTVIGDHGYWQRVHDEYTWVPRCFGCYRRSGDYHPDREEAPVHEVPEDGP